MGLMAGDAVVSHVTVLLPSEDLNLNLHHHENLKSPTNAQH
jgi:hypothetical protein